MHAIFKTGRQRHRLKNSESIISQDGKARGIYVPIDNALSPCRPEKGPLSHISAGCFAFETR